MARPRSRLVDLAVYAIVRTLVAILQMLPWNLARSLAEGLAWLMYRINRRHREVARENLQRAYPEWSSEQIDHTVRQVYRHFCLMLVELTLLPRKIHEFSLYLRTQVRDPEDYRRAVDVMCSSRPLMVLTGHLGNWEVLSYALGVVGHRAGVIARNLDNPYLDRFLKRFRVRTGQRILSKSEDYEEIQATLARGESLAMLGDQDAGQRGLYVDFFGRPASTFKAIGLLSVEYQAPILVFATVRQGDPMRYLFMVEDVILPEDFAHHADPVKAITQRYTAALERLVRQYPEQYFWLHRRWKHQPKVREKKKAA